MNTGAPVELPQLWLRVRAAGHRGAASAGRAAARKGIPASGPALPQVPSGADHFTNIRPSCSPLRLMYVRVMVRVLPEGNVHGRLTL